MPEETAADGKIHLRAQYQIRDQVQKNFRRAHQCCREDNHTTDLLLALKGEPAQNSRQLTRGISLSSRPLRTKDR